MRMKITSWPASGLPAPSRPAVIPRFRALLLEQPISRPARAVPDWLLDTCGPCDCPDCKPSRYRRVDDLLPGEREFTLADARRPG